MWKIFTIIALVSAVKGAEVRLLDLEPTDAQQLIEKQDTSLNYAPKIESNVPAVRFLGNEPHHVREDIYLARQYHGQDGLGGYLYGYNVPDIAKTERKKAGGDLRGAYNYIAGNGQEIKVEYWDDGNGFHQVDNVPKILPKQVDDSPEVKAAKEKFLARWHEEAERNSHPAQSPYDGDGQYRNGIGPQPVPQYQQPGQYQPPAQYQQPGQYQQAGQYQQPGQYQQAGQYQQSGQYETHYQQAGQYQPGQYHQAQNQQGQYQSQAKSQLSPLNQLTDPYTGQYSDNQNVYERAVQPNTQQSPAEDTGAYDKKYDEEDTTGPPKGFLYSFDYPVGIIVKEEGLVRSGDVKQVYDANKAKFESQLQSGHSDSTNQGYLFVKNNNQ